MSGKARIGSTVIGSLEVEVGQPRLAGQARPAVHLGAARAALGGLAVPADGEVGRLVALDPVEGVEDDHPLLDRHVELVEAPLLAGAAAEDLQVCVRHPILRQWALLPSRLRSSSDIAGSGVAGDRHRAVGGHGPRRR